MEQEQNHMWPDQNVWQDQYERENVSIEQSEGMWLDEEMWPDQYAVPDMRGFMHGAPMMHPGHAQMMGCGHPVSEMECCPHHHHFHHHFHHYLAHPHVTQQQAVLITQPPMAYPMPHHKPHHKKKSKKQHKY
ncbi:MULTISPECIES: hypothetical protein [Bacillaceae]|uniref:hypothetical protein n=1 Tax=Bacillaceae TaxID=186817 RepID=UPI000E709371|nr:hypothetical protein [Bacillus sp. PK3_68]RJS58832.1 hypothetical protein CJ483_01045 [Bacillus sp. PK3_68]